MHSISGFQLSTRLLPPEVIPDEDAFLAMLKYVIHDLVTGLRLSYAGTRQATT